jgi:transposase
MGQVRAAARRVERDLEPDSAEVAGMTGSLIVGIDPGRYGHGVVVLGPDGEEALRERVANEATAIETLVDRVAELAGGPGKALWVIEADGGDGVVLIGELLARDELVATLTPTEVAMRRKGRRQVHKSDLIDAELCARIGREEQATLRRLIAAPEAVAEMRVLERYQDGLIRDRTRLINRLRFLLSQYWPEFLAARAFAAFDGDAVTALLVELPTPSAVRSKTPFEIASLLAAQRYRRRPLERAEQVLAAAQVGPRPQEAVYGRLVAEVAGELRELKLRIEALDEEIRDRFLCQPEAPIILSLPGMSHRTGPRFLAEVGALARFASPDALAAYAGLTPTLWQSGRSSGTHFLTRRCNLHLRQACWAAALGSLKTPASRRFYDRKRSEGKSHHQAIIALARTQLRVLWTMLRAGTLFSTERALQAA